MGKNRQFLSKHVRNEVGSFVEPEGDQFIVQLARSRGGNTMECECPDGSVSLFWLPSKFSKVIWAQVRVCARGVLEARERDTQNNTHNLRWRVQGA